MSPGSGQLPDERPEGPAEVPLDSSLDTAIGYFNSGKLAEAEEAFKKILAFVEEAQKAGGGSGVAPLQANIYNILGLSLQMQGKLDEAAESFEKSIFINPDFPNAHFNFGKALFEVDRLDEAAASFEQAANLDPELAEAHSNLGIVSMKQGRLDEAIERFGRVLAINPGSAEGHNNSEVALLE